MKNKLLILMMMTLFAASCSLSSGGSSSNNDDDDSDDTVTYGSLDLVYVDASNTSTEDGTSWATAYSSLQDGLDAVAENGQIWVAAGTYYPSTTSDREESFELKANISLYGGFSGSETEESQRDYENNVTILSGDIDGNGILDGNNSYHVVRGSDDALLDGFTITMGYAVISGTPPDDYDDESTVIDIESGYEDDEILRILTGVQYIAGGGLLNLQAAPTVQNCIFDGNYANKGGAVYNMTARSYPTDTGTYDTPTYINCIFQNNEAEGRGGAINNDMYTSAYFISCQFLDNICDDKGGALYADMNCDTYLYNVLFAGNTAERAAAITSDGSSSPILINVSIVDNEATDIGGSLYQGTYGADGQTDGQESSSNDPRLVNCLVLGNVSNASGTSVSNWHDDALVVDANSVIEYEDGTYTKDAYFMDPNNGDYTSTDSSLGWDPDRDVSGWSTIFDSTGLSLRTYEDLPYDVSSSSGTAATYYVDENASGSGTGDSWANAYTDLQSALSAAAGSDIILIAKGTYYPTTGSDREQAFVIPRGVTVKGGFPTGGGTQDIATNVTILSGDIDGDDVTDGDNSYHVVIGSSNSVIEGFTITGGYADGDFYHQRGAGMLNYDGESPTVQDCIFDDNYAIEGAGMANFNYSSPTVTDCTFSNNEATRGGAFLCRTGAEPAVTGTTFSSNQATDRGGAVYVDYGAAPTFSGSCSFTSNTSGGNGGAVYVDDNASQIGSTGLTISSCSFTSNESSGDYGGAIFGYNSSTTISITGCTFSGNSSSTDGNAIGLRFEVTATISGNSYTESNSTYYDDTCTVN